MKTIHSIAALGASMFFGVAQAGTITVSPERPLRISTGLFRCTLWNQGEGFPIDYTQAAQRVSAPISGNQAKCVFKDVQAGKYAISVLHDEDENKKMAVSDVGAPEEGFGFTNEAQPQNQQTPSFESAAFQYDGSNKEVQLMILYRRSE